MTDTTDPTRLMAVLAADAAGFARLMADDDRATLAALDAARSVFRAEVEARKGRVVDTAGDSILAAFDSATAAVAAALAIQPRLRTLADAARSQRQLLFRIGIHLGDVIERIDGTLYGDGVNIAARLQQLAEPGAIVVSHAVHGIVARRVAARFDDLGEPLLKNVAQPLRVWRVAWPETPHAAGPAPAADQSGTAPAESAAFTAPATPAAPAAPTNLPSHLAPLFGRDDDIAAVREQLQRHAVVTIAGAGGMGKTRVAQAAASGLGERFADGVWWVELAALSDPELLPATVGRVVGAHVGESAVASLVATLAPRHTLLVLDNCEHLLDAAARLVEAICAGAPDVRILVTSQEPLRIAQEHVYRLGALPLPAPGVASGAVDLFVARARALDARFVATDERLPAIVEICRRLDGIPLAIELAAARVPLLGVDGLQQRLDERFKVLTAGSRVVLRRHQTLRATLDWSHGLLSADEQSVLHRLGVFAGTFTLASAERVASDARIDRWAVLDHLGALVDKSLVIAQGEPQPRYRLLETTRAYALEKLGETGQTQAVLRRHAESVIELLRHYESRRFRLDGADRAAIVAELDNVRAAIEWAESSDDDAIGLGIEIGGISSLLWLQTALTHEGLERCLALRDRIDASTPKLSRAMMAKTIARLGTISFRVESFVAAGQAADLFRELGETSHLYEALAARAASACERGETQSAKDAIDEALRIERPDFPGRQRASLAWSRSRWYALQGRIEEALEATLEQARLYREDGLELGEMIATGANVTAYEIALGRYESAERRGRHALERMAALGATSQTGHFRSSLALCYLMQGRLREARAEAAVALPLLRQEGDEFRLLDPLSLGAALAGRFREAARLIGFVDTHRARSGAGLYASQQERREQVDRLLAANLTPADVATLTAEGAALGIDAAFAIALADD